ncbi:MAG: hypothetical protein OK456_00730 [Thaumarchaeota archaeon]|nr:hypothetical protein [Nitrososphaerota archaeon]
MFHNYIREHDGLEGKAPVEAAGIKVEGENKLIRIIQNASRGRWMDSVGSASFTGC